MIFENVTIESVAYEIPPVVLSSGDIENRLAPVYKRIGLPFGRLELMTGIKERRLWESGTRPSDGAVKAGAKAIDASGLDAKELGAIVMCSVCKDFLEPATACVVHNALGLSENALVFDMSNACLGVLSGMIVLGKMIESGVLNSALLVAGENSGPLVETTINTILSDHDITRKTIKAAFRLFDHRFRSRGGSADQELGAELRKTKTRGGLLFGDDRPERSMPREFGHRNARRSPRFDEH